MTDDTIRVTALDETLEFGGQEELAAHVESFVSNRIYSPIELAAIRKLAALGNGDTPPDVKRTARETAFHSPEREDPEQARLDSPFGARIRELEAECREEEAELEAKREALEEIRAEMREKGRRGEPASAKDRERLRAAEEDVKEQRRSAFRAKAAWNKARQAADRWRWEQRTRYHNPDDPDSPLTREELHERLDRR